MVSPVHAELSSEVVAAAVDLLTDGLTFFDDLSLNYGMFFASGRVDDYLFFKFTDNSDWLVNCVLGTFGVGV